jgi:signal transduction histidine kinase
MQGGGARAEAPISVLLVEDNTGFAYFIRDVLLRQARGRFRLTESTTLAGALDAVRSGDVAVILLDLGLPDSAGFETFARMQFGAEHVPILVLTCMDDDALAVRAVREGAQDYLVKDQIDCALLVRAIRYAVERARKDQAVRRLSARLMELQDAERRRIALALHDSTAQSLAALAIDLSLLNGMRDRLPADALPLLDESMRYAGAAARELRTTSYLLHPPLLDALGLAGALREYADGFAERSGIRTDLELPPELPRLPEPSETALFRVVQECLTNIHRHSGSRTASIRIGLADGEIVTEVRDSGHGIARDRMPDAQGYGAVGVGIAGMSERMRQLGGRVAIESGAEGTCVTATLPLPREAV